MNALRLTNGITPSGGTTADRRVNGGNDCHPIAAAEAKTAETEPRSLERLSETSALAVPLSRMRRCGEAGAGRLPKRRSIASRFWTG